MNVLLTGATGYVGGCLLGELLRQGHAVRCLVRNRAKLEAQLPGGHDSASEKLEIITGDAADPAALATACALDNPLIIGVDFFG